MQKAKLLFEYSPWFILACLCIGALYAYLLYKNDGPWSKNIRYLLASLRFLLASLLAFLLIGPFLRQIRNTIEKPSYVFAIDNSSSIKTMMDENQLGQLNNSIKQLSQSIRDKSYNTEIRTFNGSQEDEQEPLVFDYGSTDLDNLLKSTQTEYEGRGVAGVVLISDGIYNQGLSPNFSPYRFPIYTVGVGDTIPKPDISINAIYYNKIAYQGNKFPIVAEIIAQGIDQRDIEVTVSRNGQVLNSKSITISRDQNLQEIELLIDADRQGMQHYEIGISEIEGEFTTQNNYRDAYVDIIEGKEKILLVARAPHPDIKMIRNAILKNDNYDFILHIPGLTEYKKEPYDLAIFHQIPDVSNSVQQIMEDILATKTATWFIVGSASQIDYFNRINNVLEINANNYQTDNVTPSYNNNFQRFLYEDEHKGIINDFAPVTVPYGEITMKPNATTVLFQQVGSIVTQKPLLAVNDDGDRKSAVMLGEGMWQWRIQEYANHDNQNAFDDLFSKMVQYLSAREDKRKFKVYPVKNEVFDTENIVFETEIYNDVYERIYDQEIDLTITAENGSRLDYAYRISENNSRYTITGLAQGVYNFQASTLLDGKKEISAGEFTVKNLQLEDLSLTANHQLLRSLAIQNGGKFYTLEGLQDLINELSEQDVKSTIYTSEAFLPIINLPWVFFLLILLVTVEWFTRKYNGGY